MGMKYSLHEQALYFACNAHDGQLDDNGKLHIFHCVQVYSILLEVTDNDDILAAALLHDTLEDTPTTFDDLVDKFGPTVANLVKEVTHSGSNQFPNLVSREAILIKFADRLSNLSRMDNWSPKRQAYYLKKSKFWKS